MTSPSPANDGYYHPASEAEIVELVRHASRTRTPLRVIGSSHSEWAAIQPGFVPPGAAGGHRPPAGMLMLMLDRFRSVVFHEQGGGVVVDGEHIGAATAIWAAGVQASRAAEWLNVTPDRAGRVPVGTDLRPLGEDSVFVIGDTAACTGADGTMLPGVAAVAKQQGEHVAKHILATIKGRAVKPFRYRNYGNMATIGRNHAVADFGRIRVSGQMAWLLWCVAHIWFLSGYRNRFVVGANWFWNYLTFARGARLITGDVSPDLPATLIPRPALRALNA